MRLIGTSAPSCASRIIISGAAEAGSREAAVAAAKPKRRQVQKADKTRASVAAAADKVVRQGVVAAEVAKAGPGGRGGGGGGGRFGRGANFVPLGTYRIVLNVDGQEMAQVIRVEPDPVVGNAMTAEEWSAMDAAEEEAAERLERGDISEQDGQQEMRDIRDPDPDRDQERKDHD